MLDEHPRLDLVALEDSREHVDAEPAPSTGLSSTVIAILPSFTARSAGGTPFMPVTMVLPPRFAASTACMAPSATIVVGRVDRLEIRIGDQRILGLLEPRSRVSGPSVLNTIWMSGCFAITSV